MAENAGTERVSAQERIRDLTATYQRILERYHEIERLSRVEREQLESGAGLPGVIEVLRTKKRILNEIRVEEARMKGAREWWKKTRRSLSAASCRELLSLLDAISIRVEEILAIESECRGHLDRLLSWGSRNGRGVSQGAAPASAPAARLAYARSSQATPNAGGRP